MKRQNTTGLAPSAISGLSSFTSASSFGSGAFGQAFRLRDESGERAPALDAGAGSTSTASASSASSSNTCSSSRSGSAARRLRRALAAAAGDEPTQRISASVPQKASRRRRWSGPAPSTTPRQ